MYDSSVSETSSLFMYRLDLNLTFCLKIKLLGKKKQEKISDVLTLRRFLIQT